MTLDELQAYLQRQLQRLSAITSTSAADLEQTGSDTAEDHRQSSSDPAEQEFNPIPPTARHSQQASAARASLPHAANAAQPPSTIASTILQTRPEPAPPAPPSRTEPAKPSASISNANRVESATSQPSAEDLLREAEAIFRQQKGEPSLLLIPCSRDSSGVFFSFFLTCALDTIFAHPAELQREEPPTLYQFGPGMKMFSAEPLFTGSDAVFLTPCASPVMFVVSGWGLPSVDAACVLAHAVLRFSKVSTAPLCELCVL